MPVRKVIAGELSRLFDVLSHPQRIRIVEELGQGEKDVNELAKILEIPQPGVSQHLALLRSHKLVKVRKENRHGYYSLTQVWLAHWILQGLRLIEEESSSSKELRLAAKKVKSLWMTQAEE